MTTSTKHPQELPLGCEDLDAMVVLISNIHLSSSVISYILRPIKLSLTTAFIPKGTREGEVRVQNLYTVIVSIRNIHLIIGCIECDATRIIKL